MKLPRSHSTHAAALGRDPAAWLAFGLGSGLIPFAPGTWGAVLALPLAWGLHLSGPLPYALVTFCIAVAGVWLCGHTAHRLGVHDHPGINFDEVAGQLIACAVAPPDWRWFVLAFVLFRFFDIVKPWPIRWLDRHCGGGLGIMADDIAAGIAAGVLVWGCTLLLG